MCTVRSIVKYTDFQNLEETHALRVQREQLVDELWDQFQTVSCVCVCVFVRVCCLCVWCVCV